MAHTDDRLVSVAGSTHKYFYMRLWPKDVQELIRLLRWHKRDMRQLRNASMMRGKHTQRARRAR